ncbi:MAG: hypothetical protein HKN16_11670, partial [Saprospiraceae bacterium]|nr:hypothetical protein [Saprospiraceae bacterium]
IAIIGYNYFLGTPSEKESSKRIIDGVKEVGKSVGTVIQSETEKFSEGKMDRVIDDLGSSIDNIRSFNESSPEVKAKANKLEEALEVLGEEMKEIKERDGTEGKERRGLRDKLREVEKAIEKLQKEAGMGIPENN